MTNSIILSTKNFKEASKIDGNNEFTFIVGDKKVYCHKFVAAFISHTISQMLLSDPTINSFHLFMKSGTSNAISHNTNEKQQKINNQIQDNLIKLIEGTSIDITENEYSAFKVELQKLTKFTETLNIDELSSSKILSMIILSEQLDNDEIREQFYSQLFQQIFFNKQETTTKSNEKYSIKIEQIEMIEKVFKIIQLFRTNHNKEENIEIFIKNEMHEEYNEIIDSIASHFYEYENEVLKNLSPHFLRDILSSDKLQIESEDSLLHFLLQRRLSILNDSKNDEVDFYLEFVDFEKLSEKGIEEFLNEIEFDDLNRNLWNKIKKRLLLKVNNSKEEEEMNKRCTKSNKTNSKSFSYDSNNQFNGIFKYLSETTNGNIHSNKTIEIKSSHLCCGKLETLVDFNDSDGFTHVSGNPSPRWLQIDFKTRKVQLNSYLIKSKDTTVTRYLRSWKIEISDDGNQWKMIDDRNEISSLNGDNKIQLFNISTDHKPFRFIRIISDKNNWFNNNGFSLGKLELFGQIY